MRVLLVDDNKGFLAAATRLLARQGLEIAGTATNGSEAVQMAAQLTPNVALIDIDLGGESGFDVAGRILESGDGLAVIMISSHALQDFEDLIAESPAAGFVSKTRLSAADIYQILDGRPQQ
jgi:two-component system nitrate/nitrite response regulator NarL